MRILYWHRTLADGAEGVHIRAMVDAFRALGHEVQVADLPSGGGDDRRRGLVERVRAALPRLAFETAAIAYNLPEYRHVLRTIQAFQPAVLYARHAKFDVAALHAARRRGVPAILEVNTVFTAPDYHRFEPLALAGVAAAMERRSLKLATLVTAVSSPLARQVTSLSGVRAMVVPNGADPVRFDPAQTDGSVVRARYGLGDHLVLGWTGILRDWHGLERLIDALRSLPDARLLIVGDGPSRPAVERHASALGVRDRVVISGRVPHDQVPHFLAAMNVAVVAGERTGVASPMKLLEYMAMGLAVLAPAADNIRDIVDDGADGLLFTEADSSLEARLLELAGSDALRRRLGARARDKVLQQRNWRSIAARVLSGATGPTPR